MSDDMKERFAALAHEQWSGWMRYMFEKSGWCDDGTVTIPSWAVARWRRQMTTPYEALPEDEKDSDRKEADKMIGVCIGEITRLREALEGMRDLWAREWDHEGGSTIPDEVERMFAALEEV